MSDRAMARADLVTGVVLFVLAVAVIYGSWTMDRLPARRIHPLSVPGLTPGILGVALMVTSTMLFGAALRRGGASGLGQIFRRPTGEGAAALARLALAAGLCLVYPLGLIGRMPYWLATTVFVTLFVAVFEWEREAPLRRRLLRLAAALAIGLGAGAGIAYVFSQLFLIRLP